MALTSDAIRLLMEKYESCTALTPAELASGIGTLSSESGLRQIQNEQSGYELGLRRGATSVMQSPTLENLCVEILLLRVTVEQMGKTLTWYKAKLAEAYHQLLTGPRDG